MSSFYNREMPHSIIHEHSHHIHSADELEWSVARMVLFVLFCVHLPSSPVVLPKYNLQPWAGCWKDTWLAGLCHTQYNTICQPWRNVCRREQRKRVACFDAYESWMCLVLGERLRVVLQRFSTSVKIPGHVMGSGGVADQQTTWRDGTDQTAWRSVFEQMWTETRKCIWIYFFGHTNKI